MKAEDLMTKKVSFVTPDDRLSSAAELMRDRSVGLVPVVNNRDSMRLEGVLTDRDIAVRCVASGHNGACRVRDHMTADHLITARPHDDVEAVMQLMEREQVRRIPMVKNEGRLTGVIAQADIARRIGPGDPIRLERLLERLSQPQSELSTAPWTGGEANHEIKFAATT